MPRRVRRLALATALVLFAAQPVLAQDEGLEARRRLLLDADNPAVMVVAHRGCWRDTAENALSGIEACVRMGVDVVELDVRRTRDGALVLMHDETVDRTTNGTGRVSDLTLAQVRALRLRAGAGGPSAALTQESPPTFAEAIQAARGHVLVNLDAKADVYAEAFAELERLDAIDLIIMKRRVTENDASLARQSPFDRVLAMPIVDQAAGATAAILAGQTQGAPVAVELIFTDLGWLNDTAPMVEAMDARVWVNTLNPNLAAGLVDTDAVTSPDRVWGILIDRGVDMLQTDAPSELIDYLHSRGLRSGARPR
jgi:glycerophosphoryl diester phosphodiesterase